MEYKKTTKLLMQTNNTTTVYIKEYYKLLAFSI